MPPTLQSLIATAGLLCAAVPPALGCGGAGYSIEWQNRQLSALLRGIAMPQAAPAAAAAPADAALQAMLHIYTRDLLDRGGWNNPYLREAGYDTPSRLLVTPAGDGVTSLAQVIRHIEQRRPQLALNQRKR